MKKEFDIEDIIDSVGNPIKKNTLCLGIDVAEIKTGLCLLRTDDKKLYIEGLYVLNAKRKKEALHEMVDKYVHEAVNIREQVNKDSKSGPKSRILIIEDCWFGKSVWTLKILAKFAVVVYLVFKKWATATPDPIQPVTARKLVGFKKDKTDSDTVKEQVHNYLVDELDVEIDDEDLADAFVLALAGLVEVEE